MCLASLGEGLRRSSCTGTAGAVPARCLCTAWRIWHRLHLHADVQPTSELSAVTKIRKGSGLSLSKGPSVAERNRVFQLVCNLEHWLPGWKCTLGIYLWLELTDFRGDGELCVLTAAQFCGSVLWCALLSVPPHNQSPIFCLIEDFCLLKLELMLNSLRDLNHIFLFLIRMLYKGSLCFLAVYISFTFFNEELLSGEADVEQG